VARDPLHRAPGLVSSTAIRLFGNGVTTYIVLPKTSGCHSCPCCTPWITPVTTCRFMTLVVLMASSVLSAGCRNREHHPPFALRPPCGDQGVASARPAPALTWCRRRPLVF